MELPYEVADCPACAGSEEVQVASREEIAREMEALWEFHMRRLDPGTPSRYLADRVVFSQDPPLRIGRCAACGTLYRNPRERGRDLLKLYAEEELDGAVLQGLFEAQRRTYRTQAGRLTRYVGRRGVALEVGSYVGAFQAAAREVGWEVHGVDLNDRAVRFAGEAGFQVRRGEIDDAADDQQYDAVTIWNCFDQLPHPRLVLRAARARLRPRGALAIRVPSGGFYARLRRHLDGPAGSVARTALAHNNLLGFPYRTGYTAESLSFLLRMEGFEEIAIIGDTLVPVADRWTRPWARWEERAVKAMIAALATGRHAPWLEVYARRVDVGGASGGWKAEGSE